MPKFNLLFGIEQEQYNLHVVNDVELPDERTAIIEARAHAEDLYMQNPKEDIMEIMERFNVEEDTAKIMFKLQMIRATVYQAEEIVEVNGEIIETITHLKK